MKNNKHEILEWVIKNSGLNQEQFNNLLSLCIRKNGDAKTFELLLPKSKLNYGHFYQMGENKRIDLINMSGPLKEFSNAVVYGVISGGHYIELEEFLFSPMFEEKSDIYVKISVSMLKCHYSQARILMDQTSSLDYEKLLSNCLDDECRKIVRLHKLKHE